jgi:hypothetical protein
LSAALAGGVKPAPKEAEKNYGAQGRIPLIIKAEG